jgi:alpha-L-fucosidase
MHTSPIPARLKIQIQIFAAIAFIASSPLSAQTLPNGAADTGDSHDGQKLITVESPEALAHRLAWWTDARFGMFIHWGLYSQWGCHYPSTNGTMLNGQSEHMMQHLQMPLAQYAKIADVFDPTNFNAAEWVSIAKNAGMKYIVITAKHHDGFAMFNSPSSDYNIVKRTPWKRDPIKELADACHAQGLKFCVYYSLGRDWEDPDVPTKNGYRSNTWDYPDESKKDFSKYFERKVKPQVRELLTQYGPIGIMWFDTPEMISKAESAELVRLIHSLQPDCLINARVGNRLGDYAVQEQKIPAGGNPQPWETCMTLNGHWGYFLGDENWKPAKTVIHNLVDIVSKGGNYLLNVGPTGQGIIPQGAVNDLQQVGDWMKTNAESIRGTTAGPVKAQPAWGRVTSKGDNIYLHVFDWPTDGKLVVPEIGQTQAMLTAHLLADKTAKRLKVSRDDMKTWSVTIDLPPDPLDPIDTVVVLQL